MLLLLIIPVWSVGLVIIAGLCFAARVGDRNLQSDLASQRAQLQPHLASVLGREHHGSLERAHRSEPSELVA